MNGAGAMNKPLLIKCAVAAISGAIIGIVAAVITGMEIAACPAAFISSLGIMLALTRDNEA